MNRLKKLALYLGLFFLTPNAVEAAGLNYRYPMYPYSKDLSQTLTFKVMLRCALPTDISNMDMSLVANYLRQIDCITRGMPKIVVLGGYQKDGHDHQYPWWTPVDDDFTAPGRLKGKAALQWLMEEARKYHTDCTFHVNPFDAYEDSPKWDEYVSQDLLCRSVTGSLVKGGVWWDRQSYFVNMVNEWNAGVTCRRIDDFISALPGVEETGVLYFDNLTQYPASPHHGVTSADQITAIKRTAQYLKEKYDIQLIGEYADPNLYGFDCLGVTWDWFASLNINQMEVPAYIACGGRNTTHDTMLGEHYDISKRRFEVFGASIQLEDIQFQHDPSKVVREFTHHTLVYFYLNRLLREKLTTHGTYGMTLQLSDNVVSKWDDDNVHRLYRDGKLMKEGYDVFMPVYWVNHKEIMAYSLNGRTGIWDFPREWDGIASVDLYKFNSSFYALEPVSFGVAVENNQINLTLPAGEARIIVPAGTDPNQKGTIYDNAPSGSVEFVAEDASTSGNWTNVYGKQGYDIFGAETVLPSDVKVEYAGDTLKILEENSMNNTALKTADGTYRIEAVRTSVLHQIIDVDVTNPEGKTVSLYIADYQGRDCQMAVDAIDVTTRRILHSRLVNRFTHSGKYLSYHVKGHVQFRLTRFFYDGYYNPDYPVCSGLFIDGDDTAIKNTAAENNRLVCFAGRSGEIHLTASLSHADKAEISFYTLTGARIYRNDVQVSGGELNYTVEACDLPDHPSVMVAIVKTPTTLLREKVVVP